MRRGPQNVLSSTGPGADENRRPNWLNILIYETFNPSAQRISNNNKKSAVSRRGDFVGYLIGMVYFKESTPLNIHIALPQSDAQNEKVSRASVVQSSL